MTKDSGKFDATKIDWAKGDGLIPAIVQDARSLRVLMLGFVNQEALEKTLVSGLVTFYSRTKQRLWQKGETSGHVLHLKDIKLDCDQDTLLMLAEPEGPTCHLGTQSCFGDEEAPSLAVLADLAVTIRDRHKNPQSGSYTAKLFSEGVTRIAQKVGEEGVEVALAASTGGSALASESADLLYHLLVLLEATGTDWRDVMHVLKRRAEKVQFQVPRD
jgi:phosphoribosyl-ATP pyrophosphohydrolase/phosphoribosyl-AMP cyclohydrolase